MGNSTEKFSCIFEGILNWKTTSQISAILNVLPLYFKVVAVRSHLEHKLLSDFWCVCKTCLVPSGLYLLNLAILGLKRSLGVQYLKSVFMDGDLWQLSLEVDSMYQPHDKATFHLSIIYCFLNWSNFPLQISSVLFELEDKLHSLLPNILKCSEDKCMREPLCSSVCLMTISVKATTYMVAKHDLGEWNLPFFAKC